MAYQPFDLSPLRLQKFGQGMEMNPFTAQESQGQDEGIWGNIPFGRESQEQGPFNDPGIFAPKTDFRVAPVEAPQVETAAPEPSIWDQINKGYTPETMDRDRLRALMDNAPEMNQPGLARTLVAAAAGFKGGPKAANEISYAPYMRDLEEWKNKAEPFYKTAELENRGNINERTLVSNAVTADVADRRTAQREKEANQKYDASVERNRIARYKAEHGPDWTVDARNGPTVMMYNKTTGESKNTGISTRWMSEADKIEAEGRWDVRAAEARGAASVATAQAGAAASGRDVFNIDGKTFKYNPKTGGYDPAQGLPEGTITRPGSPSTKSTTTSTTDYLNKGRGEQFTLRDIYERDSGARNKYITKNETNGKYEMKSRPVVKPAGWGGLGTPVTQDDVNKWDEIKKKVDPTYVPPSNNTGLGPPNTPAAAAASGGYTVEKNASNPMEKRRTKDGKTFEFSHDGGQTWGAK